MAYRTIVEKFLKKTNGDCQVICLGAGFDTLYWHLHSNALLPKMYLEVDFVPVVAKKSHIIRFVRV